ncbi:MAG: hypothetical protein NT075_22830, partial [Chloroflexi bacterium]|nr:hypothetical protein [Chloroflexota bacterium]
RGGGLPYTTRVYAGLREYRVALGEQPAHVAAGRPVRGDAQFSSTSGVMGANSFLAIGNHARAAQEGR